jgi:hypothetical protein
VIEGKVVLPGGAAAAVAAQTNAAPAVIANDLRMRFVLTRIPFVAYHLKTGKAEPSIRLSCEESVSIRYRAEASESAGSG